MSTQARKIRLSASSPKHGSKDTEAGTSRRVDLVGLKNADGRPVWEPPILSYNRLIGEEYEQKRKAYLIYTGDDVARTTELMDIGIEYQLSFMYFHWIVDNRNQVSPGDNSELLFFWDTLLGEVDFDVTHVMEQWEKYGIWETRTKDGTYEIINNSDIAYYTSSSDGANEQSLDLSIPESLPTLDANTRPLADSHELFQDLYPPSPPSPSGQITRWPAEAGGEYVALSQQGSPPTMDKNTPDPPIFWHHDLQEDIQDRPAISLKTNNPISSHDFDQDEAPMDLMTLWW